MRRHLRLVPLLLVLLAPGARAGVPTGRGGEVSIFYYPWYANLAYDGFYAHWQQGGHRPPNDIASSYYPLRGAYSSTDPAVVDAQMSEIAGHGISQVVVSWWGRGSFEDARLPAVIAAAEARGLSVAIHLEPYDGRTAQTTEADVAYLRTLAVRDFYVYDPATISDADWATLNDRLQGVRVFAQTSLAGRAAAGHFDGVYTYDVVTYGAASFARLCAEAHAVHLLCAPSVGPGFDARRATGDPRVKPRRRGETYDAMWRAAIAAHPDRITITSYNEWHEGTQIEPASPRRVRHGFRYETYSGAYGRRGASSSRAYLRRTAFWARRYAAAPSTP